MARKLRIDYGGAIYHVINRGNYRRDLFETVGAAAAFLRVLFEARASSKRFSGFLAKTTYVI